MGNVKVVSDEQCSLGNPFYPGIAPSVNPADNIIVRSKPGISIGNIIKEYSEQGKKIYELDDYILTKPTVNFSNNAGVREVGETIPTVVFNGSIIAETNPIASRSIVPDPGGLDLTAPFTFSKLNVKRTTPGIAELHTVTAIDNQGNSTIKTSSVAFKHAVYQGFNELAILNEVDIKALVNKHIVDSIVAQYQGTKEYVVPGPVTPKYIYWVGPIGSPVPVGALLSGLTLPLYYQHPNVQVVNIHDPAISVSYWVVRTLNRFNPDTYQITLS